jgi:hypothetical protein
MPVETTVGLSRYDHLLARDAAMIFHDSVVQALDLNQPARMQELIEIHLCGHSKLQELSDSDQQLLEDFVAKAVPAGITFQQLNELLLVLNQDRVSAAFFTFFFGSEDARLTMDALRAGVIKFKGFAMVCFGNFRFAYRRLSTITSLEVLRQELGPCCRQCEDKGIIRRAPTKLSTSLIERDDTWFVGEITGRIVGTELPAFEAYRKAHSEIHENEEAIAFGSRLAAMDEKFQSVQQVALRNTDVYLTWDHLDVYVATSMRNKWEYLTSHRRSSVVRFSRP